LYLVYPNDLGVKVTTDNQMCASFLDLSIEIYNEGRLKTKLYDKLDDFPFRIVNLQFNNSNIATAPVLDLHFTTNT
jgi:5,10-methenyltetrahydromethanopterin hydrogenase